MPAKAGIHDLPLLRRRQVVDTGLRRHDGVGAAPMGQSFWCLVSHHTPPKLRNSLCAACQISRAAFRFIRKMPSPTARSGHAERYASVTTPAATIATLAIASLRADRNAARVRLPCVV